MQYQQQYQSQTQPALHHPMDSSAGLTLSVPISHMHPSAYNMSSLGYPNLISMQSPYMTTTTPSAYGTIGTDSTNSGGYPQPGIPIADGSNYYPAAPVSVASHAQPSGQVYYGQQPQVGPASSQIQHPTFNAGTYSMQGEASPCIYPRCFTCVNDTSFVLSTLHFMRFYRSFLVG